METGDKKTFTNKKKLFLFFFFTSFCKFCLCWIITITKSLGEKAIFFLFFNWNNFLISVMIISRDFFFYLLVFNFLCFFVGFYSKRISEVNSDIHSWLNTIYVAHNILGFPNNPLTIRKIIRSKNEKKSCNFPNFVHTLLDKRYSLLAMRNEWSRTTKIIFSLCSITFYLHFDLHWVIIDWGFVYFIETRSNLNTFAPFFCTYYFFIFISIHINTNT